MPLLYPAVTEIKKQIPWLDDNDLFNLAVEHIRIECVESKDICCKFQ